MKNHIYTSLNYFHIFSLNVIYITDISIIKIHIGVNWQQQMWSMYRDLKVSGLFLI
jgi:hypothetical protein